MFFLEIWVTVCLMMCTWVGVHMCASWTTRASARHRIRSDIDADSVQQRKEQKGGILWEDPRVCKCVKSANGIWILTRLTWKEEHERGRGNKAEIEETWKMAREKEINEREKTAPCVCLCQPPEWLRAAGYILQFVPAHRCCHISLTGQQDAGLLRPFLTSMWIITQRRKILRRSSLCAAVMKLNNIYLMWSCEGKLRLKSEKHRRTYSILSRG